MPQDYNCGDRTCGAVDCRACYPMGNPEDDETTQEEQDAIDAQAEDAAEARAEDRKWRDEQKPP